LVRWKVNWVVHTTPEMPCSIVPLLSVALAYALLLHLLQSYNSSVRLDFSLYATI
jgi:hypothetical protein